MDYKTFIELVGYAGSFLVIVSMLMTSVVKLRIINTVGSVIFATYAMCIHSYPTAAMQVCLITINIVSLYKLLNIKKEYTAIKLKNDDSFLNYFLKENLADIKKFFPELSENIPNDCLSYLVVCNSVPAGIFVCKVLSEKNEEPDIVDVILDYTTPTYRDCSVGKYLYDYLAQEGVSEFHANSFCETHTKYLKKMGFTQSEKGFIK